MLGLLYFGRLEKEKGIDGIIEMIELFEKKNQKIPFELFIFGSGSRESKIQELTNRHKNIHFFWRQSRETIKRYVNNCQYCLMPSECLESFWLSALSALQRGLISIGYAKWGLKDFIDKKYDLTHQQWHTTGQKLHNLIKNLWSKNNSETLNYEFWILNYSKDSRIVRFHALAGKQVKKVLIVSDFINKIGGIETYINDVKALLEPHGYEIELCWWTVPWWPIGKFVKYLGFITGMENFRESRKIQRKINQRKPDLIRYNSVMRYLWRMPIRASKNSPAKKRMMFHDLGYFAPFPSALTEVKQIRTPFTLRNFLRTQPTKNPLKKLAMIGKYISLRLIGNQLKKNMDTFLVPSDFMIDIVHKSYKINKEAIKIFPHFIQE